MTAALTEPLVKYDPRKLTTSAIRENGSYILNGSKVMVPYGADAELFLVYANLDEQTQAFLIPAGTEGLLIGERDKLMGVRALPTFHLDLVDCRVSTENQLGGEKGIDFNHILNHGRLALGAAAVGMARAGYEYALLYAKNREQFGEPKIGKSTRLNSSHMSESRMPSSA